MNKPEKLRLRGVPDDVEVVHERGSIVLRKIVDVKKFRAAAAQVLKHIPKPKKGADVVRRLNEARLRGRR